MSANNYITYIRRISNIEEYKKIENNIINYLKDKKYGNVKIYEIQVYLYRNIKKEEYEIYSCALEYEKLYNSKNTYKKHEMFIKKYLIDNYLQLKRKEKLNSIYGKNRKK